MPTDRIPVTILTGFLGAGKTTLLNRILNERHGLRIAVIENEYGEIGIDQGLVIEADEEIFEMSNGCICCTVRGDLIRVLGNLTRRKDKFDIVLVETTGLADPGPVAQTFFMDEDIREEYRLDAIVTLVDAKHVGQQLGRSREATEQVAFADVIVLNKTDLVAADELDAIETRLRQMNRMAKVFRTKNAELPIDRVLAQRAFDLDKALARRPTFLEPEYPFEWTGVFTLEPGRYEVRLDVGPDPDMTVVATTLSAASPREVEQTAERCVRWFAEPPVDVAVGGSIDIDRCPSKLELTGPGHKSFYLTVDAPSHLALYTEHLPEEFGLCLVEHRGPTLTAIPPEDLRRLAWQPPSRTFAAPHYEVIARQPALERRWVAAHEHDDEVGSVAIETGGSVDHARLTHWLRNLLQTRGADIFRMKGFISIEGEERRFVFQGVHMLFDGRPDRPWGDLPRTNQLVFIGRNLDARALREGFAACLR